MAMPSWVDALFGPVADFFVHPTLVRYMNQFLAEAERDHPDEMRKVYWVHQHDPVLWGQFRAALVGGFTVTGVLTSALLEKAGPLAPILGEMLEQPINSLPRIVDTAIETRAKAAKFPNGYSVSEADALAAIGTMLKSHVLEHIQEAASRLIDQFGPTKLTLERAPDQYLRTLRLIPRDRRFGPRGIIPWFNRQSEQRKDRFLRTLALMNELGEVVDFANMADDERVAWVDHLWQARKLRLPFLTEELKADLKRQYGRFKKLCRTGTRAVRRSTQRLQGTMTGRYADPTPTRTFVESLWSCLRPWWVRAAVLALFIVVAIIIGRPPVN